VADDSYLIREFLTAILSSTPTVKLTEVCSNGSVIDPLVVDVLIQARSRARHSRLAQLTSREREVLAKIATGKSNAAIADSLVLTKRAVEKHVNSIFSKLDLPNTDDVSRRVKATLIFLDEQDDDADPPEQHVVVRTTGHPSNRVRGSISSQTHARRAGYVASG